jgi:hypothetical protein
MTNLRRGLALGMTAVALATVIPSAAAAGSSHAGSSHAGSSHAGSSHATPSHAASSQTKKTICVALIVDGRSLGSNVRTDCAKVPPGSTGIDVLQAAGHSVGFRSDGLLCTIDGLPKTGCAAVNDTHYWAYFHRAPGTTAWTYSSEGASTYQPKNDSTEGWVYDNGKTLTPKNVPYAQICPPTTSASPTPTATATAQATKTAASAAASSPASRPATASARPHHTVRPKHAKASHPTTPAPLLTTTKPASSARLVGGSSPSPQRHPWIGLGIGLVVVLLLGGLAAWRFRRTER